MSITIIATDFHKEVMKEMTAAAQAELSKFGVKKVPMVRVLGSFEIPLIADKLLAKRGVEAVVVLGFIEKGETLHGEVMGHTVHSKLLDLGLKYKKPIGFGIIGPGATLKQAKARTKSTARRAVQAVFQSLKALKEI
ncbi:MAG: 6,7-dimethyl-8-ribityllumazine synthase [Parcubacteria group bacterium Gr01-1014_107]|nr:MAG: 6,7-dimethyl-8-ribityllumazine synthase [Parcubacteria group bacterium Gr01-1014_107]